MANNETELLGRDCFLFELSCELDGTERSSPRAENLRLLPDEFEMAEMGAEMDEWMEGVDGADGGSVIVSLVRSGSFPFPFALVFFDEAGKFDAAPRD